MDLNFGSPKRDSNIEQACAVPFRAKARHIEFCLITSSSGRWMFPKGFVEPGESFAEAALKEALEEAGLHGRVIGDPIGSYIIEKNGGPRVVIALLMQVLRCDDDWEEAEIRERCWVTPDKAYEMVSVPGLNELLEEAEALARSI